MKILLNDAFKCPNSAVADLEGAQQAPHPLKLDRLCFFPPILYQNA